MGQGVGGDMDFAKVLDDLHEQLRNLDMAIESLEHLQNGGSRRRRGRPPNGSAPEKGPRKINGSGGKKRG
jgi:hypothetical protein